MKAELAKEATRQVAEGRGLMKEANAANSVMRELKGIQAKKQTKKKKN